MNEPSRLERYNHLINHFVALPIEATHNSESEVLFKEMADLWKEMTEDERVQARHHAARRSEEQLASEPS